MQALQFSATGTLDSLQLRDVPTPVPEAGEVMIEVRATGINPSDVKNVLGSFPYTTTPRIPGRDFSGVVVSGSPALLGRAVWGGTGKGFGFYRDGCHAQYVVVSADAVALMPASLSFSQAATCGVPFITAWDALERSQVQADTRFLIIGGGAVASAAQALGKARGANVVVGVRRAACRGRGGSASPGHQCLSAPASRAAARTGTRALSTAGAGSRLWYDRLLVVSGSR